MLASSSTGGGAGLECGRQRLNQPPLHERQGRRQRGRKRDRSRRVWNRHFAGIFGVRDVPILAVYSHMIDAGLYLPDYPIGHLLRDAGALDSAAP